MVTGTELRGWRSRKRSQRRIRHIGSGKWGLKKLKRKGINKSGRWRRKEEVDCEPAGVVLTENHWALETSEKKGIWEFVRLGLTVKGNTFSLNKA